MDRALYWKIKEDEEGDSWITGLNEHKGITKYTKDSIIEKLNRRKRKNETNK